MSHMISLSPWQVEISLEVLQCFNFKNFQVQYLFIPEVSRINNQICCTAYVHHLRHLMYKNLLHDTHTTLNFLSFCWAWCPFTVISFNTNVIIFSTSLAVVGVLRGFLTGTNGCIILCRLVRVDAFFIGVFIIIHQTLQCLPF